MEERNIYIKSATQISLQSPLSEDWMTNPVFPDEPFMRSQDPNFRDWLPPLESRRMGKIMRRAVVTALKVMNDSGIATPDAVITGTGLGCIENTELFLDQLCREGEEMLKPTYFMQSTHNTISSLIAIKTKCHGYNSTYSHKSISFESALMDAFTQMKLGDISTALVTGNDEMTPSYFNILQRSGYVGQKGQVTAGEASVSLMLSTEGEGALCEVEKVSLAFWGQFSLCSGHDTGEPSPLCSLAESADAVMMGYNGNQENDAVYDRLKANIAHLPVLQYKNLFGECYSASGLGIYAAAHCLKQGYAPAFMRMDGADEPMKMQRLLVVNHSDGQSFSGILLKKVN